MPMIEAKEGNIIESNESEKIVQRTVFSDSSDKKSLARTTLLATPSNGGHPRNAPNLRNP